MSAIADWLEQQLQRRGVPGQELPYDADVKWTVRQHLLDLVAVSALACTGVCHELVTNEGRQLSIVLA